MGATAYEVSKHKGDISGGAARSFNILNGITLLGGSAAANLECNIGKSPD